MKYFGLPLKRKCVGIFIEKMWNMVVWGTGWNAPHSSTSTFFMARCPIDPNQESTIFTTYKRQEISLNNLLKRKNFQSTLSSNTACSNLHLH